MSRCSRLHCGSVEEAIAAADAAATIVRDLMREAAEALKVAQS